MRLTDEQERNVSHLAYWTLSGQIYATPMGFSMTEFCLGEHGVVNPKDSAECGTVGCFLGHGTLAGIECGGDECWTEYSSKFIPHGEESWAWVFDGRWSEVDNTPEGAAKRALWLLEFGLPNDWQRQIYGKVPLCYADWEPEIPAEYINIEHSTTEVK